MPNVFFNKNTWLFLDERLQAYFKKAKKYASPAGAGEKK